MDRDAPFDAQDYEQRVRNGPCFVCAIRDGVPPYRAEHEVIYEDEDALVFLNRYPTLRGYTLVFLRLHVESVTGDFSDDEYLRLLRLVYFVVEAIRQVVPTERLYI